LPRMRRNVAMSRTQARAARQTLSTNKSISPVLGRTIGVAYDADQLEGTDSRGGLRQLGGSDNVAQRAVSIDCGHHVPGFDLSSQLRISL
jgi:hypothetical protein